MVCRRPPLTVPSRPFSSLFKYLTEEVENEQGEPYFYRNVMKKVSTKKKKETLAGKGGEHQAEASLGDETIEFLEYVDNEYQAKLSNLGPLLFPEK